MMESRKRYTIPLNRKRYESLGRPDLSDPDIKRAFYIGYGDGGIIGIGLGVEGRLSSLRYTAELMGFNEVEVVVEIVDNE
nr:MAG: hypothetical protein 1 [Guangxi cystovirus 7]QYF49772.1 MAG: hypothetical protein 1 [Guangxi cystovirus 15]